MLKRKNYCERNTNQKGKPGQNCGEEKWNIP